MKTQSLLLSILLVASALAQSSPAGTSPVKQAAAPEKQSTPSFEPLVAVRHEDYREARKQFHTRLLRKAPSPSEWTALTPPAGVTEVEYTSGPLHLKAWVNAPTDHDKRKYPAVLFLHGGHAFAMEDWEMPQGYRDAGFIVMAPMLRGENGQPGEFSMFYDEVDDVIAAAEYLRRLPYVDARRVFVAGHSVGGTMTMLSAMTYTHFHAAASVSGSPDQALFTRYAPGGQNAPFDASDPRELEMRSPLSYAESFKCPVRIYFGTQEPHFDVTSRRTAEIARGRGQDAQAVKVDGNHVTLVPESIKQSIEFFNQVTKK